MTSIEWFISQLEEKGDMRETPSIRNLQLNIDTSDYLELKREAKEMHKQECIKFYVKGCKETYGMDEGTDDKKDAEQYYQETFGSKGSDDTPMERKLLKSGFVDVVPQQEICINCDEQKETHEICMDCIGKLIKENQKEISDEEIEKEIKSRYETPHYNSGFMDCAKWYREQLKQRQ